MSDESFPFSQRLIRWHARSGRKALPWQATRDPYRVWLSEIMLQQTQVATVLGYYERFLRRFPTVTDLAAASLQDVMPLWAGLGYYARARNLHACARAVVERHGGVFPQDARSLHELPGIGRSTAAAIAAFCFDERAAILDGNVKRVLSRHFLVEGAVDSAPVQRRLWALADSLLPAEPTAMPVYTQAIMDLGAMVCTRTRPACTACPLRDTCGAEREGRAAELPSARARRATPLRMAVWQLLLHRGRVLLEERGAAGLWGGLLTAPEYPDADTAEREASRLYPGGRLAYLPSRRHQFTHFTLQFTPLVVNLDEAVMPYAAEGPDRRWLALSEAERAAVPAPLKSLLIALHESAQQMLPLPATAATAESR